MTELDLDALARQFDPETWAKGLDDAKSGRVQACSEVEGMRGWYRAQVGGSSPHTVEFQLGRTVVHGQCTCEARYDCRHLAAAVLTLADASLAGEVRERKLLTDWLERLGADPEPLGRRIVPRLPNPELPPSATREVRYLARVVHTPESGLRLLLEPRVGPRAETADATARATTRAARLTVRPAQSVLPVGVVGDDLDLWHALRLLKTRDDEVVPPVEGAAAVLRRFIDTGRVRWEHWHGPTFTWSPRVIRASPRWTPSFGERQTLRLEPDAPHTVVLPLDQPLWLDPDVGACGPLADTLPLRIRREVYNAPVLRVDVDVDPTLQDRLKQHGLPTPLRGPVSRVEAPLTPVLHLQTESASPRATLAFEYDGAPAPLRGGHPSVSRWDGSQLRVMPRDPDAEAQAFATLRDLGFEVPDERGHLPLTPQAWVELVDALPVLRARGWAHRGSAPAATAAIEPAAWYLELDNDPKQQSGWFSFELGIDLEGAEGTRRVNLLPVLVQAIEDGRLRHDRIVVGASVTLRLDDGTHVRVKSEKVQRILDGLLSMSARPRGADPRIRVAAHDAAWLAQLEVDHWQGHASLQTLGETLLRGVTPDDADVPASFCGFLRDYQRTGIAWMQLLHRNGCGGVLADDMGLGKTVQVLVHVLAERSTGRLDRPCLVVAPVSVLGNWVRQAAAFTPELKVGLAHGSSRASTVNELLGFDLVLTSYATLLRDERLRLAQYHIVALDEAQAIKNPRAKISGVTRAMQARQRIALTGTPVENNLLELWSIFRFVAPGLLGSQALFSKAYARPMERSGDAHAGAGLRRRTAPFLLRRTKDAVLKELPPKTEIVRSVILSDRERELYETVRRAVSDDIREALRRKGLGMSRIVVLEALLRLRQICCDARLAPLPLDPRPESSAKLDELDALLEPLVASGRRVLVFSQFTKMLKLIADRLDARSQPHLLLTGKTRNRQHLVDRFQAREVPLMLISLKAGGTGLNLTAADTVVLYDPWWNPAVEQQAIDRTHRIGQDRPVTVYRLVCEGSVEERILALQARKRQLAETVQTTTGPQGGFVLEEADVDALLAPLDPEHA